MGDFVVRRVALEQTRGLRREVLRPHQTLEQVAAEEWSGGLALAAFEGEELIATGSVVPEGGPDAWRIRGMATAPAARGRGAGTALLDALIAHARAHGARRIWCNARTPARSLYERAGMRVVSDEIELPAIGPHYVMELSDAT